MFASLKKLARTTPSPTTPGGLAASRRSRSKAFLRAEELEARAVPSAPNEEIARALDLPQDAVVDCYRPNESRAEFR